MEKWRIIQIWDLKSGTYASITNDIDVVDFIHESEFEKYGLEIKE
jgi:hypothetical protein